MSTKTQNNKTAGVSTPAKATSATAAKKTVFKQRAAEVAVRAAAARTAAAAPRPAPATAQRALQTVAGIPRPVLRAAKRDVRKTLTRLDSSPYAALHTQKRSVFTGSGSMRDDFRDMLTPDDIHPSFHSENTDTGMRVTGVEYVAPVGDDGALEIGDNLAQLVFNPLDIGARLPLIAQNYARWKANRVRLCYKAAIAPVGTDANGLILMGANMDPVAALPADNLQGVIAGESMAPNATIESVWKSFCIDLQLNIDKQNELYVSNAGDERLLYQFKAYIMAATALADVPLGAWMIAYDVTFDEPTMDTSLVGQFLSGYSKIYTSGATPSSGKRIGFSAAFESGDAGTYIGDGPVPFADDAVGFLGDVDFYRVDEAGRLVLPPGAYVMEITQAYGSSSVSATTCTGGANSNSPSWYGTPIVNEYSENTAVSSTIGPMNTGGFGLARFAGVDVSAFFQSPDKGFGSNATQWNFSCKEACPVSVIIYGHTYDAGSERAAVKFNITRVGAGTTADADAPDANFMLNPRGVNTLLEQQRVERLRADQVVRALAAEPEDCASFAITVGALVTARRRRDQLLKGLQLNYTAMAFPALAGVVSWFVHKYGARLGKAATEWAVRKIEEKLR